MDFTAKYTLNDDEKIVIRKINDLLRKSEKTYSALYSGFLTPAAQTLISHVDEFFGSISFTGGYDDAERRLCRVCTEEYAEDNGAPIVLYSAEPTDSSAIISHRDVLGSLMGLGIKRETIGDILVKNSRSFQFFCHTSVAEFVELNLKKIGHYRIFPKRSELSEIVGPERAAVSINVSAMRLDCICAECFGLSRTKAAECIKKGAVSVNWLVCDDPSKEMKSGDKISMRGKGKVEISDIGGKSKKGRLFVNILKYV